MREVHREVDKDLMPSPENSLLLIGAGLASAVIARRLVEADPSVSITMVEASNVPFGEHTWSFHLADVSASDLVWLDPLIAHRWGGQSVRFLKFSRHLNSGYASLTSQSVAESIAATPSITMLTGKKVGSVDPAGATLEDGTRLEAACVVDARGFAPDPSMVLGHQKFVGLEVETEQPHGITDPVIMDASVDQFDGYRFIYLLPFSPTRILIEDTRYSDGEALDLQALAADVGAYAEAQGWSVKRVVREEHGVLPIALAYDAETFWGKRPADVPQAGMRAGLFHPTTGYSLPEAVRVANLVAAHWPIRSAPLAALIREHALQRSKDQGFYRLLNRMLFRAAEPSRRHLVLQRFYRLPQPLIERFYAGRTTAWDICRILVGKPPVPVHRALACLTERSLLNQKEAQ
jgi:lycopene beta-cyclase